RECARVRRLERFAPLECDPEQLADQPLRDSGAGPAPQEAQHRRRVAVVDEPERLRHAQRAADHLRVRGEAHRLFFPDGGVGFAGLLTGFAAAPTRRANTRSPSPWPRSIVNALKKARNAYGGAALGPPRRARKIPVGFADC